MAAVKKKEITFTKSPTGLFKLGYHVGDTVKMNQKQANELIEAGVAVPSDVAEGAAED